MPSGYEKDGRTPDVGWWMDQIHAGEEFRKIQAHQHKWETWRSYYRGKWRADILPVNLFFSMLRTIVPRVYFRNPAVSVTPGQPGFLNMAFAQVVNRIDNKVVETMRLKQEMKKMVQDAFLFGTGIGKMGYGALYSPSPGFDPGAPIGKTGRVEFDPYIEADMPWFRRVHPRDFVVPDQCGEMQESRWVAHRIYRNVEDLQADTRLVNTKHLKPSRREPTMPRPTNMTGTVCDEAELWEIRDSKYKRVILIASDGSTDSRGGAVLLNQEDRMQKFGFPFKEAVFNPDDEYFWGIPDSQILEPYQLEINEIKTQNMKHRRLALVKLLVRYDAIDDAEIEKMLSEDVAAVVKTKRAPKESIDKMQVTNIPQDLYMAEEGVMKNVREMMGFSRNQSGEYQSRSADITATEANIVQQGSEIRVDERRDQLADVIVDLMKKTNDLLFEKWDADKVVDVVGPGGAQIWVKFNPGMLKMGSYVIKVDPDSAQPRGRGDREQKAMGLYQILAKNPLIDPMKLTQYLLSEVEGTQMDDLMRALPPVPGAQQNMDVGQFAGMLQKSLSGAGPSGESQMMPALLAAHAGGV